MSLSFMEKAKGLADRLSESSESKFLFGAGGVYLAYMYYGVLQEHIYTTDYSGGKNEKFTFSFAMILFQALISWTGAYLINRHIRKKSPNIPLKIQAKMGFFWCFSMLTSMSALQYVSYPIQALVKSSKILSVMLVSLLIGGRKHSRTEYLCALLITGGIVMFNLGDGKKKKEVESTIWGLLLCFLSLLSDGLMAESQNQAKDLNPKPAPFELKGVTSKFGSLFCLAWSFWGLQIISFFNYATSYPQVAKDVTTFSLTGASGLFFMYYIVGEFSPLSLSIVTTTRKFFTVLFSIFWYNHDMTMYQWMSVLLVFTGVTLDTVHGYHKKKKAHSKPVKPEEEVSPTEEKIGLTGPKAIELNVIEDKPRKREIESP